VNYFFDAREIERRFENTHGDISFYKQLLKDLYRVQQARFLQGTPAAELIRHRAWVTDLVLRKAWQQYIDPQSDGVALLAVGGYGRGELHPASDIDVMVLLDNASLGYAEAISGFSTFLWDIGLEPGLSVRNLAECEHAASGDVTIMTNLVEARLITGPSSLFDQLLQNLGTDRLWSSQEFFQAKLAEQRKRHHKFHDTAYNLEPNVKEGPGGLRDIHMVAWVAKRHFQAKTIRDLYSHNFLTKDEYLLLAEGQNFLWSVRFALHIMTGRREDRLFFDHQRELALMFGYSDDDKRLAVEHLMKRYYRTIMELGRLNEMLLQLFAEAILSPETKTTKPINRRFHARNGYLEISEPDIFKKYPFALLEIFLLLEQYPQLKGVRASTIRAIRAHHYLIDENFRNDLRCISLFMELIRQPRGITHELRRMNRYGVLALYLPAFGRIVGQMQYDLFHVYTVDEHSLFVLRNLRRFSVSDLAHEFPFCSQLFSTIPKPELLYLGALFHDIAKGRGGDHSELGADEAKAFCVHHGLSRYDSEFVAWLVRNHLLLSTTAQRKDISDPDVIAWFAGKVATPTRLDYLFLLTVADIRGTNATLWNAWREALLTELYEATRRFLQHGTTGLKNDENVIATQREALKILRKNRVEKSTVQAIWATFMDEYFVRHDPDVIAWHTQGIAGHQNVNVPLVLIRPETSRGDSEIFLYTMDQDRLFAATTSLLDQLDLNIVNARIITTKNGYTQDSYIVLENTGDAIKGSSRSHEIFQTLSQRLANPEQVKLHVHKHVGKQFKFFRVPLDIQFQEDLKNNRTIMELTCTDEPGLLSRVGQAFVDCNILLQTAKAATYGTRAEDTFFICNNQKQPINHAQQQCLRAAIGKYLSAYSP